MSKIIYLKDGGSIKVSNYEKLVFEKDWIHIRGEYRINRYITFIFVWLLLLTAGLVANIVRK